MKKLLLPVFLLLGTSVFAGDTLHVKTPEEFVKAIGPNRVIMLEQDTFQLRDIPALAAIPPGEEGQFPIQPPYVSYLGGNGVVINNVSNLQLIGKPGKDKHTVICTSDYANTIMTFRNCDRLSVYGIEFNHIPHSVGHCTGGVLFFDRCDSASLDSCRLIGSGADGLLLDADTAFTCAHTSIEECSVLLFEINECSGLNFSDCLFSKIRCEGYLIVLRDNVNVQFTRCRFEDNYSEDGAYTDKHKPSYLFLFYDDKSSSGFMITQCSFTRNKIDLMDNKKEIFTFEKNTFSGNDSLKRSERK